MKEKAWKGHHSELCDKCWITVEVSIVRQTLGLFENWQNYEKPCSKTLFYFIGHSPLRRRSSLDIVCAMAAKESLSKNCPEFSA